MTAFCVPVITLAARYSMANVKDMVPVLVDLESRTGHLGETCFWDSDHKHNMCYVFKVHPCRNMYEDCSPFPYQIIFHCMYNIVIYNKKQVFEPISDTELLKYLESPRLGEQ